MTEDNAHAPRNYNSQAIDSVLMEQLCQRKQGYINEERLSALYRLIARRPQVLAWERAAAMCITENDDDDDVIVSTNSARIQYRPCSLRR
jgi:hypothetical protein